MTRRLRRVRGHVCGWLLVAALLSAPAAARETMPTSQAELIRGLIPSVVNITARAQIVAPDAPGASQGDPRYEISVSAGSGFIIDASGLIATNWHVVADASEIIVTFSDGSQLLAKVLGAARVVDLALLKVDASHPLQAIRWGDSNKVQIGDPVLAMGNPLGIGLSVSAGIVSALNRNIGDTLVDDFIQTDAAINHGNSGGPLFDLDGEVIGVNAAIISPTTANAGLGFAMPSNDAQFVFQRLANVRDAERPAWLGAKLQAVTPEIAEGMGQRELQGAIVAWVLPDGPAQRAGLLAGDVIRGFDNEIFSDERALMRWITTRTPGQQVAIDVWRNGQQVALQATLDPWPQAVWERNAAPSPPTRRLTVPPDLGLAVADLTGALRTANRIAPDVRGVLVTAVTPGCDAAREGVAAGDVVLQVGPNLVSGADELRREIARARSQGRQFGLLLLLPKKQPVSPTQFPGPKWVALRIASQ